MAYMGRFMTSTRGPNANRWVRHLIGAGVTGFSLWIFVRQVNTSDLISALINFSWEYLAFGITSLSFGYALRIIRWSMMLRATGAKTTFGNCAAPFLGSIALNNVLPLRLGDVIRALVFPRSMGISKTTATSSLIVERLIDLMTLLVSLAIGLYAISAIDISVKLKESAVTLATVGGVVLIAGFLFSGIIGRFFNRLSSSSGRLKVGGLNKIYKTLGGLLHGFNMMSQPRLLLTMIIVSMIVWVGEAGLFYFVLVGSGVDGSPFVALLVMAVATLSTLVPSSPGYVGTFHLAAFTAISLVGATTSQAASYAVIVHMALWLPTTLAGALAIWISPELFRASPSKAFF